MYISDKEQIIDRMIKDGDTWTHISDKYHLRHHFWYFVKHVLGADQYYNWKENKNYLVFKNEKYYLLFLLKL